MDTTRIFVTSTLTTGVTYTEATGNLNPTHIDFRPRLSSLPFSSYSDLGEKWSSERHKEIPSVSGTVRRWRFVNGRDPGTLVTEGLGVNRSIESCIVETENGLNLKEG